MQKQITYFPLFSYQRAPSVRRFPFKPWMQWEEKGAPKGTNRQIDVKFSDMKNSKPVHLSETIYLSE